MDLDVSAVAPGRPSWLRPWLEWLDTQLWPAESVRPVEPAGGGEASPLDRVAQEFGLSPGEALALVIALAPEVDRKYREIYAYLNDDLTRPLPTIDLCLRISPAATALLDSTAAVYRCGLLHLISAPGAPHWRHSGLVAAWPVREYLLGLGELKPAGRPGQLSAVVADAAIAIKRGQLRTILIDAPITRDGVGLARDLAAAADRPLIEVGDDEALADAMLRARLARACLLVRDADSVRDWLIDDESRDRVVVLLVTDDRSSWRPVLAGVDHVVLAARAQPAAERAAGWAASLRRRGLVVPATEISEIAELFPLSPSQIEAATASVARDRQAHPDLARHARAQSALRLPSLVTPVSTDCGWDDLVLPVATLRRLHELSGAIRHRRQVFDTWTFSRLQGSRSLNALFSGVPGTGKTMSAAVIARELGLPLCRLDLSAVVSKYIGDTERNLETIFRAVESTNALLMFDEADALFGKRSEVSDAHDRYANIEVAYLLQRVERFDGVLLLATNLSANVDEAFSRRIHYEIEFPIPDRVAREELWARALPVGRAGETGCRSWPTGPDGAAERRRDP